MTTHTAISDTTSVHDIPVLMTIEEVARHLGVTVRHVRRLVAERRIPFVKWGHLLRFDPGEIASWLRGRHVAVNSAVGPNRVG